MTVAGSYGGGRMADMHQVRRPTGVGRVHKAGVEIEVLGNGYRAEACRRVAEIPIDVRRAQPGVGQRAKSNLRMDLGEAAVRDLPPRMLVGTGDERAAN